LNRESAIDARTCNEGRRILVAKRPPFELRWTEGIAEIPSRKPFDVLAERLIWKKVGATGD
jgi:hypothetical protein